MAESLAPIDTVATLAPDAPAAPVIIQPMDSPAAEVLVPLSFFLFIFASSLAGMVFKYRTRRLVQEERLRAMELHLPVPPEARRSWGNPYILPMLLVGVGVGLLVLWLNVTSDDRVVAMAFGMIALLSGLGWLAAINLNRGTMLKQERMAEQESRAYVEAMSRLRGAPVSEQASPPATPSE